MKQKLFDSYIQDIENGTLSESRIRLLRRHIKADPRYQSAATETQAWLLVGAIQECQPRILPDQAEKGITWLRNQWKTPKGRERKNNPFNSRHQHILENFSHFTFVDFYDVGRMGRAEYLPVYRVHAKDGATFDYVAGAWQSSSEPGLQIL